jgi:hypothetical protein
MRSTSIIVHAEPRPPHDYFHPTFQHSIISTRGLTTLLPHRVPFKFVNSVADAWPLMAPHLRRTTRLEQMQNAVDQLRDAISSFAQRNEMA